MTDRPENEEFWSRPQLHDYRPTDEDHLGVGMKPECAPLCGASKAYGRFDKPWYHEQQCPVRIEWEKKRAVSPQERSTTTRP